MTKVASIMIAMLLALFAVASVAHASSAASMNAEMVVMQASGSGGDVECDDCGSGDEAGALACDAACVTPMLAVLDGEPLIEPVSGQASGAIRRDLANRSGIPDPSPPRTTILS